MSRHQLYMLATAAIGTGLVLIAAVLTWPGLLPSGPALTGWLLPLLAIAWAALHLTTTGRTRGPGHKYK